MANIRLNIQSEKTEKKIFFILNLKNKSNKIIIYNNHGIPTKLLQSC